MKNNIIRLIILFLIVIVAGGVWRYTQDTKISTPTFSTQSINQYEKVTSPYITYAKDGTELFKTDKNSIIALSSNVIFEENDKNLKMKVGGSSIWEDTCGGSCDCSTDPPMNVTCAWARESHNSRHCRCGTCGGRGHDKGCGISSMNIDKNNGIYRKKIVPMDKNTLSSMPGIKHVDAYGIEIDPNVIQFKELESGYTKLIFTTDSTPEKMEDDVYTRCSGDCSNGDGCSKASTKTRQSCLCAGGDEPGKGDCGLSIGVAGDVLENHQLNQLKE